MQTAEIPNRKKRTKAREKDIRYSKGYYISNIESRYLVLSFYLVAPQGIEHGSNHLIVPIQGNGQSG
jgi:hypothetical protein